MRAAPPGRRRNGDDTMDRRELVGLLDGTTIPEDFYDIVGVHTPRTRPDAYYFLRPERDVWAVGLRNRGQETVLSSFDTEDAACRDLYDRLLQSCPARPGEPFRPPP